MRRIVILLGVIVLTTGCGEEEQPAAPPGGGGEDRLVVEVRPEGEDGPVERREVRDVPAGITARDFEPVPPDRACTQIYGGPQTARVTGTLNGDRIDARFSRNNGCEIARWDAVAPLLGEVDGSAPPPPSP